MRLSLKTLWVTPYGDRQPDRPVASWSRLALPMKMPPASRTCWTAGALDSAMKAYCGQAAVVVTPATSMVSLTEKGTPNREQERLPRVPFHELLGGLEALLRVSRWIQTAGSTDLYFSILSNTPPHNLGRGGDAFPVVRYELVNWRQDVAGQNGGVAGGVSSVRAAVVAAKKSELFPTEPNSPSWPQTSVRGGHNLLLVEPLGAVVQNTALVAAVVAFSQGGGHAAPGPRLVISQRIQRPRFGAAAAAPTRL